MLNNIDLFSGIGGFSYAFHGKIKTIAYCDIDENCRNTLKSIMSKGLIDCAPIFKDVRSLNKDTFISLPHPNMITAGFPCQDISTAHRFSEGLDGKRSSLFFEIIRLCKEIQTIEHVFLENVPAILKNGMIERVQEALKNVGFNVEYKIVSAKILGAPHTRRRCFILATKNKIKLKEIRLIPNNHIWDEIPETMIKIDSLSEKKTYKTRCCMCGNSIVPSCIIAFFNNILYGDIIVDKSRVYNIKIIDDDKEYTRPRWGTPYASFNLYKPYRIKSYRSRNVLFNQVWYSPENINKKNENWTISPIFVEWMMGYPPNYTE